MENIIQDENEEDIVEISSRIFSESKEARINQDNRIFQGNKQNEDSELLLSESSDKTSEEFWGICFEYYTNNTVALRCGHIFHQKWIDNVIGFSRKPSCPNWRKAITRSSPPTKLIMDPQILGSEKRKKLLDTKKRLRKNNEKLKEQNKSMKVKLEEEEKSRIETIKTLERQYEENEKEIFKEKTVDRNTMETFVQGKAHSCWENNMCEDSQRFKDSINQLKRDKEFVRRSQIFITNSNIRFMRNAIDNGIKSINEHRFETTLPFYIQRAKKLDYLMDMSEINKRKDVFLFEDNIYEVYNDFGADYPKELFIKYRAMLDELKLKRIENPSEISQNNENSDMERSSPPKKFIYDENERMMLLDQACTQIENEKATIKKEIDKTKKLIRKSNDAEEVKEISKNLDLLKKQSKLLDDINNEIIQREKNFKYYKSEQERIDAQDRNREKKTKNDENKSSKNLTLKEWKSLKHKEKLKSNKKSKNRGIHSSEETKEKRAIARVIHKIFYEQEKIDFKELYKKLNISF